MHHVNLLLRSSDVSLVRLDGQPVTQSFTQVAYNTDYKFCKIQVSAGSHTFSMNGGDGFIAYAFGLGNHESYAYSVGASMHDLSTQVFVNDTRVTEAQRISQCRGTPVLMHVEYREQPDSVVWSFGDGTGAEGDSVNHTYSSSGDYNVTCHLVGATITCGTGDVSDVHFTVHVYDADTVSTVAYSCDSLYTWHGESFDHSGVYDILQHVADRCDTVWRLRLTLDTGSVVYRSVHGCDRVFVEGSYYYENDTVESHYSNAGGCDSTVIVYLTVSKSYQEYTTTEGCDSLLLNGRYYHDGDTATLVAAQTVDGCDSIVRTVLRLYPSFEGVVEVTINEGDTLRWINGYSYTEETEDAMARLRTVHGCDSIIRLHLHVIARPTPPPPDSSAIWVPNVFTPNLTNNREFKVFCNDLLEIEVCVFTRWGLQVTCFDGLEGGWDGTWNGRSCKQDAYIYHIRYRTKSRPQYVQTKTGTVMLLR